MLELMTCRKEKQKRHKINSPQADTDLGSIGDANNNVVTLATSGMQSSIKSQK